MRRCAARDSAGAAAVGVVAALAGAAALSACLTVRRAGNGSPAPELDRAGLARCAHADPGGRERIDLAGLAGEWRLVVADGDDRRATGRLSLAPYRSPEAAGSDAPLLIGDSDVPFGDVGAIVPGDADAHDPAAPGVGLYALPPSEGGADGHPILVLRVGSESNRRDRQRFDGAHTTLRVRAIDENRFGGTWSSAEGAREVAGSFCATRSRSGTP